MKRYWKMIVFCVAVIIVIGTFYIRSGVVAKAPIELNIEKVSGNEKELQDVILYGDYVVGNFYHSLEITDGEKVEPRTQTFLEEVVNPTYSPVIQKLVKNHKGFMRGKDFSPNYFFEDDHRVAYASLRGEDLYGQSPDFTFEIAVKDKSTNEITAFEVEAPKTSNHGWLNVENVQLVGNELKVITSNHGNNNGSDMSLYTFNISEKKMVDKESFLTMPEIENSWVDITLLNEQYYSIQPQKYLLVRMEAYEEPEILEDGQEIPRATSETIIYDTTNSQVKKWEVPDEIAESLRSAYVEDSTVFLPNLTENEIEVNQYDIETEKWKEKQIFHINHAKDSDYSPYIQLMDGKIYIIGWNNDTYPVLIGDLGTGEILYEGKIEFKNQQDEQKNNRLYFHEIEMK